MLQVLSILTAAAFGLPASADAKVSPPAVGAVVADFRLKDIHHRPRSLDDFKGKRAFVVVFVDTECPIANLYVPTQIELHREYAESGARVRTVLLEGRIVFDDTAR